ncbi:MAG TPA: PAS domain S-box protein [Desulfuromonadales bacterium]|nr:PAS domain S-box protein [Desulfuromonadales bacterium]
MTLFKTASIRRDLIILIAIMASIPCIIVAYTAFAERNRMVHDAMSDATRHVGQTSQYLTQLARSSELFLNTLSRLEIVQTRNEAAVNELLLGMVKQYPQFSSFFIVDETGARWASTNPIKGAAYYSDRRFFINAVSSGHFSSGEYAIGKVKGRPVFSFALPFKDSTGTFIGAGVASVELGDLNELGGNTLDTGTLSVVILDHKGTILFNSTNAELNGTQERESLFRRMKEGPEKGILDSEGSDGSKILSYQKLQLPNEVTPFMYVRAEISRDQIMKDANRRLAISLALLVFGTVISLIVAFKISERHLLKKVDENERRFRTFVENANDLIYTLSPEGTITYVAPNVEKLLGYRPDELIGTSFAPLIHLDELPASLTFLQDVITSGESREGLEYRIRHKDGYWLWFVSNASLIINSTGEQTFFGIGRDASQGKSMENDLRDLAARLEQQKLELEKVNETLEQRVQRRTATLEYRTRLLETMSESTIDGILMVGNDGKVIMTNRRFAEIWQIPLEVFDEQDDSKLLTSVSGQLKNPDEFIRRVDWLYAHNDQTSRDVIELIDGHTIDRYSSPLVDSNGECFGRAWFFRDVTDNRRLQEQLQQSHKLESVGRLAGGIAHDFNNKLSVIMGYTQLASEELSEGEETVHDYLREVTRAAELSRDITSQLLAFSRQQIIAPYSIDTNLVISEAQKSLSRLIGEDIRLIFKPGHEVLSIFMDPVQVDQILMNLAVNARDAMSDGGSLTIETSNYTIDEGHPERPSGDYVMITVSDSGCGIDGDTLAHIFEPFFTTKEVGKGTGLGLATIHGIIAQNNGFIDVESTPGGGTVFRILIPGHRYEDSPAHAAEVRLAKGSASILLVEDDDSVRAVTAKLLRRSGYDVTACSSPHAAIELFEQCTTSFDLILTDVIMPGMNGREMIGRIREINSAIRVIYMSGYSQDAIGRKGVITDHISLLQKPLNMDELKKKIGELLKT